jgi:hypothetical protein
MSRYLKALREFDIEPNFWCSEEYFKHAEFCEFIRTLPDGDELSVVVTDPDDEHAVFPLFNLTQGRVHPVVPGGGIWADLVGFQPNPLPSRGPKFLDYNYIYDPKEFQEMRGKKWMTFRKNSRKFPRRYGEHKVAWLPLRPREEISAFASEVLSFMPDEIHDAEVLLKYLFDGENRLFLFDIPAHKILAVNIWDENYKYINYRYALCINEPFLSEYIRLCFYKMVDERYPGKFVNDGGVLDRPLLKEFKDKLNPVKVKKIYSWKNKEEKNGQK